MAKKKKRKAASKKQAAAKPRYRRHPWWAGLLLLLAAFSAVALISYSPEDPSFNLATSNAPENLGGLAGAHIADLLLQTLGLGSVLLVLGVALWAVRLAFGRASKFWWMRIVLLQVSVLAGCVLLMLVPIPDSWPFDTGLGGFLGALLFSHVKPVIGAVWLGMAAAAVFFVTFGMAMALSAGEWAALVALGWRGVAKCTALMKNTLLLLKRMLSASGEYGEAAVRSVVSLRSTESGDGAEPAPRKRRKTAVLSSDAGEEREFKQPVIAKQPEPSPKKTPKKAAPSQAKLKLDDDAYEIPSLALLGVRSL